MQVVTPIEWEKFMEGIRRREIGPYVQTNEVDTLVASMKVVDALGPKPGHENKRVFMVDKALVEATAYIFIPTQEQLDEWDDAYNDMDSIVEMAKVDPGWLK